MFVFNPLCDLESEASENPRIYFAPNAPIPFLYVLVDALIHVRRENNHNRHIPPYQATHYPDWTHHNLVALLKHQNIENPEEVLLEVWFQRKNVLLNNNINRNLSVLFQLPDTKNFFEANHAILAKKFPQLSTVEQYAFLDFCPFAQEKEIELMEKCSHLVLLCAFSNNKKICQQATPLLSHLNKETTKNGLREYLFHGNSNQRKIAIAFLEKAGVENIAILEQALLQEKSKPIQELLKSVLQRLK